MYRVSLQGEPKKIIAELAQKMNIGTEIAFKCLLKSLLLAGGLAVPSLWVGYVALLLFTHDFDSSTCSTPTRLLKATARPVCFLRGKLVKFD